MSIPTEFEGGSSTSWYAYDVPQMWALIGHYDVDPQWTHVGGWQKAFELTSVHLAHIRGYRDQLATAWPPEKNEASQVYLGHIDELIASVQATYDAAVANHDTMSAATGAIMAAKAALKPLYERWQANATTMAGYESQVASARESQIPVPMAGPPPLPGDWRDGLNRQAREVMGRLSGELSLATVKVVVPPGYTPPRANIDVAAELAGSGGLSIVPPVIPPVVSRPAPLRMTPPQQSTRRVGPVLSGGPSNPPASIAVPGTRQTASPEPINGIIGVVPATPPTIRTRAPHTSGSVIGGPPTSRPTTVNPATQTISSGPLPPGAVIGGQRLQTPGAASSSTAQRENPTGGVIGRPSPNVDQGGRIQLGQRPVDGTSNGKVAPRQADLPRSWDLDDTWSTLEGVDPVVLPALGRRDHDPGPAIGRTS